MISKNTSMNTEPERSITNDELPLESKNPLFFNYHEYSERYYYDLIDLTQRREHDEDHAITVTHFPNIYVPKDSDEFRNTRVVRIPRCFTDTVDYPCFSTYLPGHEPAAIINELDAYDFVPHGSLNGSIIDSKGNDTERDGHQLFGYSSVSPLSLYLDEQEFSQIVSDLNAIVAREFQAAGNGNILDLALGLVTLGLWDGMSRFTRARGRRLESALDAYVRRVNATRSGDPHVKTGNNNRNDVGVHTARGNNRDDNNNNNRVQLVNPIRSGFLSLDFIVPRPRLPEEVTSPVQDTLLRNYNFDIL